MSEGYVRSIDFQDPCAMHQLAESFRHNGFAVLKNHPMRASLLKDVLLEWQTFFQKPERDKKEYLYNQENFIGYYPMGIENAKGVYEKNLMEYYHHEPHFALPPTLTLKTNDLFKGLLDLAQILLKGLNDALPASSQHTLPGPLHAIMGAHVPTTVMRILHYPPVNNDSFVRNTDHEDINLMTLLCSATAQGLQVKDKKGVWHSVAYDTEDIVINAGDMLQLLTDGYYTSTTHRVIAPSDPEKVSLPRYSIPLFIGAKPEILLRPGFTAYDYLIERLHENGVASKKSTQAVA